MTVYAVTLSLQPYKAFYFPGELARWKLDISSDIEEQLQVSLYIEVHYMAQVLWMEKLPLSLVNGQQVQTISWQPPNEAPRGYGLELQLVAADGEPLTNLSGSFDVLEHWTQSPRYGFLTDFAPGRPSPGQTLDELLAYQINALQFYDWMYRHDTLIADHEPYHDPLGRLLSRQTVEALIEAGHQRRIAAMPYTAVYGASLDFCQAHPDWGLYQADGKQAYFFDFLAIMDPRPNHPWADHLLAEYRQVLEQFDFDGIHIDQYGDPKQGYDAQGNCFNLAQPMADFINATRRVVDEQRSSGSVIFNAVGNWPIEAVAPAAQDLVYIEVWPPLDEFADLHNLIVSAQDLGGGKPVVLAAYIPSDWPVNVRLADSIIFASGAGHIELGEIQGLLADPYFPKYSRLTPDLTEALQHLYAFAVRYQDLIGPQSVDANRKYAPHLQIVPAGVRPSAANIFLVARESSHGTALNLVNFSGLSHTCWNQPLSESPLPLEHLSIQLGSLDRKPSRIWHTSPDSGELSLKPLAFEVSQNNLFIELSSLLYWDLIFIEWNITP